MFLRDSYFELYINKDSFVKENILSIEAAFLGWFHKKAEEVLVQRLKYYSEVIGVKYKRFCIKAQKTRWGSCSTRGNLNFNWRLIMAPGWVLDYVVVHELVHLMHMNHSKEFWDTVGYYISDYKNAVDWLKKNGSALKLQLEDEEGFSL